MGTELLKRTDYVSNTWCYKVSEAEIHDRINYIRQELAQNKPSRCELVLVEFTTGKHEYC